MREEWRTIKDWPGYEVSNLGRVRSYKKKYGGCNWRIEEEPQRALKPSLSSGYRAVSLSKDGREARLRIALLVLEAFVGPRPDGMEICHGDCVKTNDISRCIRIRWT